MLRSQLRSLRCSQSPKPRSVPPSRRAASVGLGQPAGQHERAHYAQQSAQWVRWSAHTYDSTPCVGISAYLASGLYKYLVQQPRDEGDRRRGQQLSKGDHGLTPYGSHREAMLRRPRPYSLCCCCNVLLWMLPSPAGPVLLLLTGPGSSTELQLRHLKC